MVTFSPLVLMGVIVYIFRVINLLGATIMDKITQRINKWSFRGMLLLDVILLVGAIFLFVKM